MSWNSAIILSEEAYAELRIWNESVDSLNCRSSNLDKWSNYCMASAASVVHHGFSKMSIFCKAIIDLNFKESVPEAFQRELCLHRKKPQLILG